MPTAVRSSWGVLIGLFAGFFLWFVALMGSPTPLAATNDIFFFVDAPHWWSRRPCRSGSDAAGRGPWGTVDPRRPSARPSRAVIHSVKRHSADLRPRLRRRCAYCGVVPRQTSSGKEQCDEPQRPRPRVRRGSRRRAAARLVASRPPDVHGPHRILRRPGLRAARPGRLRGSAAPVVDDETTNDLFPMVLVACRSDRADGLPRTRRFGSYMLIGVVVTALVVGGAALLVLWLLVQGDLVIDAALAGQRDTRRRCPDARPSPSLPLV